MRALVGAPSEPGNVAFRDVDPPHPGPGELVIAVRAFGVNRGELGLLATRDAGWRPGQDVAGIVAEAATDGSGPAAGTRVVAMTDFGGWSERVAAPVSRVGVLPDNVSFEDAASLPVAGLTALRALRAGGPTLGRRILITGASGGVGTFAVQLAREGGSRRVVAIGSQTELLRRLGADEVYATIDEAPGTYDTIVESVGGASLAGALHRVAAEGTVVMFGNSSQQATTFPGFGDFRGRIHAKLYAFGVYYSGEPPTFGEDLTFLASLVSEKRLDPVLASTAPWTEIARVLDDFKGRRLHGKAVFRIK